jgi:serine/threonine protein kinase
LQLHEVAQGLAYLHLHKIVHGDVKGVSVRNHDPVSFVTNLPLSQANILISDAETAILCDFGLTRMKTEVISRSNAEASAITGSPNWMAPERLIGRSLKPPADIYAFGMTIYEVGAPTLWMLPVVDLNIDLYRQDSAR